MQIAPGPRLEGANLFGAKNLTQEQLENSSGDEETVLPEGLTRSAHWKAASEEPDNPE